MDYIELIVKSNYHGDFTIVLSPEDKKDYYDIPNGKEIVFNDNIYSFQISDCNLFPTKAYINDEIYDVEIINQTASSVNFQLKNCLRPFRDSFGAVKLELEISGKIYSSKNVAVMVSNNDINNGVMNMIQYIYDNSEKYLYEEHKFSSVSAGIKSSDIVSLEAKIALLKKIIQKYLTEYNYFRVNPYAKLITIEKVDSFEKLQVITPDTIEYIISHSDELIPVNYNTGIKYDRNYYQPNKVMIRKNEYSNDTYENRIIIGFIKMLIDETSQIIKSIKEKAYTKNVMVHDGYFDSMYHIFSRSIKRINGYLKELEIYKEQLTEIYYYYRRIFGIDGSIVNSIPRYTKIFQSVNSYNNIYQVICEWFNSGNYDLGRDELLLSFISTSKIYEYYCLIKMLCYIDNKTSFEYVSSQRLRYFVKNRYYSDTRYNNCFVFNKSDVELTVYFQPVIYGDDFATNGIGLYRNTSTNSKTGCEYTGKVYTPDYLIKMVYNSHTEYLILDAKYSSPSNIRYHQLQELVYKYLFSISPLNRNDIIKGLYILCGKTTGEDGEDIIHDISRNINRKVQPFAEILVMNGQNTEDDIIPCIICTQILNE